MNKKIAWGTLIILISIFYSIQKIYPEFLSESVMRYIFNYQVIIIGIGISFLIKKKKIGWFILTVGIYFYLQTFLGEYFDKGFPILMLTGGIILLIMGFNEKNGVLKKGKNVFTGSLSPEKKMKAEPTNEIEEIEEIK